MTPPAGLTRWLQIKRPEQLGWAQRACDEAGERGLWIVHLSHPATLFWNVNDAIDCLKKINRPNFGLVYEPVNWMNTPKGYGRDVIKSVAPWLVMLCFRDCTKSATPATLPCTREPRRPIRLSISPRKASRSWSPMLRV
jgi:hypothetical protein